MIVKIINLLPSSGPTIINQNYDTTRIGSNYRL